MAKTNLVNSCSECANPCCKTGTGPFTVVDKDTYLENYGTHENWNKKCEGLQRNGKCRYWKTKQLPVACRTHVCTNRKFSAGELLEIAMVTPIACPACDANYTMEYATDNHTIHWRVCESCNYTEKWINAEAVNQCQCNKEETKND